MRHGVVSQRLSRPSDQRQALVYGCVRDLLRHGQIRTTVARAKEIRKVADRLVTLGKDGSVHSRRQAFRVLQDRSLVRRLFSEIAPRVLDDGGGYTRFVRTSIRRGDGASMAQLAWTRLPAEPAQGPAKPSAPAPKHPPKDQPAKPLAHAAEKPKPKGLLEGLRGLWGRRKAEGK